MLLFKRYHSNYITVIVMKRNTIQTVHQSFWYMCAPWGQFPKFHLRESAVNLNSKTVTHIYYVCYFVILQIPRSTLVWTNHVCPSYSNMIVCTLHSYTRNITPICGKYYLFLMYACTFGGSIWYHATLPLLSHVDRRTGWESSWVYTLRQQF